MVRWTRPGISRFRFCAIQVGCCRPGRRYGRTRVHPSSVGAPRNDVQYSLRLTPQWDFGDCLSQSLTQAQRQVMILVSGPALPAVPPYAPLRRPARLCRSSAAGARRVQAGVFMHSPDPSVVTDQPSVSRNRLVLVVYTAAIFVSALLLFSVQPLFTKMVLPRLGGSPAVWSVAMVFFQSLLLGGYA